MIIKNFEINKINLKSYNFILLYGLNEGFKNEVVNKILNNPNEIFRYDEKTILDSPNQFIENVLTKSLFENEKIIIINRVTDKIYKIIENLYTRNISDKIFLLAGPLEKKSKLRIIFEKEKNLVCIPFYPDNDATISKLTFDFFKRRNIQISRSNINQIVSKTLGDRAKLKNELEKIENFLRNGKKITTENLFKLLNLSENYNTSELIDNCLAKNKNKLIKILNENNYTNEDSILISRTLLNKSKTILKLSLEYETNNNLDLSIENAKPPIFWKEKEITKQQIQKWNSKELKKLIFNLNEVELSIKKNINNSLKIITDFLIETSSLEINN